ncbi:hypothetical protein GGS20DRAFT_581363 [Poronia punctata]|nr:hypothetical protein GGS20DRAFT_581363 [Poronia punctata]
MANQKAGRQTGTDLCTRKTWNTKPNWMDERVWKKIRDEGFYHKSDEIMISCGTVTLDRADTTTPKVLVVHNSIIGVFLLPKGRKNIGEDYLAAALRETAEETGIAVRPLQLRFGTRATPAGTDGSALEDTKSGITGALNNEAIGINPDPAKGAWRNIHWYAAKPRDEVGRDKHGMPKRDETLMPPEDRVKFQTHWYTEEEALSKLKMENERFMVRVAFEHIRRMSPDDWS